MSVNPVSNDLYLPEKQVTKPKKELDKDAFLRIMIEQLKNQDPTSPMDSDKFISQMAQFTMMEQLTNMNSRFEDLLQWQQLNYGSSLIGRKVLLVDGEGTVTGPVDKVQVTNGSVKVVVGGTAYDINKIVSVEA
ncbi:flagellar basal-body rod modification protein FlgD [Desulfohalotomaculum tongense]|uniref:flagellar hook capping FlgD N-terminal domain-containing protein n=1 Tax=Desulforadius tongensis TaxID=1216062 RepID=UPI00195B1265|nr:flagellar basal-body rod modification protein FlgD [Desulforadius tongensis]